MVLSTELKTLYQWVSNLQLSPCTSSNLAARHDLDDIFDGASSSARGTHVRSSSLAYRPPRSIHRNQPGRTAGCRR